MTDPAKLTEVYERSHWAIVQQNKGLSHAGHPLHSHWKKSSMKPTNARPETGWNFFNSTRPTTPGS